MLMLQFGEGNFLRAFVDWMVDIANEKGLTSIYIAVVSPRFRNNKSITALKRQNCRYNVVLEGISQGKPKRELRSIGCIKQAIAPECEYEKYRETILSPELKLVVSNTTEAGIRYEPDDARADIPSTFPGKVASMLYRRFRHFDGAKDKGLTFICCELIEDNGAKLKECVLQQSKDAGFEPEFLEWIGQACYFCDSLVDRIVSGFPADDIEDITAELGCQDELVVKGELYHLWAIGGSGWEKAKQLLPLPEAGLNVLYMPSIKEFRDKKVRILNGSHTAMTPMALLAGCQTVKEAFDNAQVNAFVHRMMEQEVLPQIAGDRQKLNEFASGILERFYNPYIRHHLESIALNSLSKWEARNWPTALDYYKATGQPAPCQAFALAALLALYSGAKPDFIVTDNPEHVAAIASALQTATDAQAVKQALRCGAFTTDLEAASPGFAAQVSLHLTAIREKGIEEALNQFLSNHE